MSLFTGLYFHNWWRNNFNWIYAGVIFINNFIFQIKKNHKTVCMFINNTGHPLNISIATCIQRFLVWTCQCLPVGGVFSGKPSLFSSTCTFTFIALHSIIWILFTSLFIFLFLWSLLFTVIRATVCKSNSLSEYKTDYLQFSLRGDLHGKYCKVLI